MTEKEFLRKIKKNTTQIFFFKSRMPFPFSLAVHTWIVVHRNGKLSRYDIW